MNVEWWSRFKRADNINKTVVTRFIHTWYEPAEMDSFDFIESMLYTSHMAGRDSIRYRVGMDPI